MFSAERIAELDGPLSRETVKTRKQGGREVSYVESWHVIAEANRIFGFGGWSSQTVEVRCVAERGREIGEAKRPGWGVTYTATVRVTVDGIVREDVGAGHGIDVDLGQAHESAIKEAVSDAQKRCFRMFGNKFGLALYDKTQANVADESEIAYAKFIEETWREIGSREGAALYEWWISPEQKKQRGDFGIPKDELSRMTTRIGEKLRKVGFKPPEAQHDGTSTGA